MALAELRQELKESIWNQRIEGRTLTTVEYLPERINPPIVLVSAGEPYVEQGLTPCLFNVTLEATVIAGKSTNAVATDTLDAMIEAVIIATGDWFIAGVSQPFTLEANNAHYLATRIKLTQEVEIGG